MPIAASTPAQERAALSLFAEALDLDPAEREGWLHAACGGDPNLYARVLQLLGADRERAMVLGLDEPADAGILPPAQIGPYRIAELIGAGGMGSVYRGERNDGLFEQSVAIKFIRPIRGLAQIEPMIDAERRLLARMSHPAIARILDGGTTPQGSHFLVMEYVRGVALDRFAAEHALNTRDRVILLREVCAAVAHAHQHLVLHCDIKPANILVTNESRPKLIDFGVARIQDVVDGSRPEGFTRAYTSVQRLRGEAATVADDVYSLGVVLYELIAGVLPGEPALESGRLSGELAAIASKATAAKREARYASVNAFDEDLLRWLEQRPVAAMGGDWRYRTKKLLERRPWPMAAAALALASLVAGLIVIAALYSRAELARRDAEKRFADVRALANYMLFDLDTRLEAVAGTTQARREMVGKSQQYLDALAKTASGNDELQREVAVGLARLAEVQGVPGKAHVGDPHTAEKNLHRAQQLLESLLQEKPAYLPWQRDLGKVRYLLALVYGGVDNDLGRQLAKAREAEVNLAAALAGTAFWNPSLPELAELHVLLTSTRLTQADVYKQRSQLATAAKIQAKEELRLLDLPGPIRREMEFDYQSGRPAMLLGDSLYYLNRREEALAAYRRATARFERGLAQNPRHWRLLEGALIGYWSISGTLDDLGRYPEALAAIEPGVRIGEQLVENDPANTEAIRLRDTALGQRAIVLSHLGRYDEAISVTERYENERELRARQEPDDAERARDTAVPLRSLAGFYKSKGDMAGACRVLRRGAAAWQAFGSRWKLSPIDRSNELEAIQAQLDKCPRNNSGSGP